MPTVPTKGCEARSGFLEGGDQPGRSCAGRRLPCAAQLTTLPGVTDPGCGSGRASPGAGGGDRLFPRPAHSGRMVARRDRRERTAPARPALIWIGDTTGAQFYELLSAARERAEAIYGLDCMPREDLRKIGARDRHAADKIAGMRAAHPEALILALFGESHLAPKHLPALLRERLPEERVVTVLQNVDALYWRAAGEATDRVGSGRGRRGCFLRLQRDPARKIRELPALPGSLGTRRRRRSRLRPHRLQPGGRPGALARNQPLLRPQHHPAQAAGGLDAGSLFAQFRTLCCGGCCRARDSPPACGGLCCDA